MHESDAFQILFSCIQEYITPHRAWFITGAVGNNAAAWVNPAARLNKQSKRN